jgi:CTP synthase
LVLEEAGIGRLLVSKLNLKKRRTDLNKWRQMVSCLKEPCEMVTIALVGKYVELEDAYYSVREALSHAGLYHNKNINLQWIHSENLEKKGGEALLRQAQGIIVPGGFGDRGIGGMIKAATYARENKIPYLGLCLGMQVMVIEFARHVLGKKTPHSAEFDKSTPHPVIDLMPAQKKIQEKGGTMRLGLYPCKLTEDSRAANAYKNDLVYERHRHRYEFNNDYRETLMRAGMRFSGLSPDEKLIEICELESHPWMMSCQFHPEFGSRPGRPHPLFRDFIGAAKDVLREGAQPSLPLKP